MTSVLVSTVNTFMLYILTLSVRLIFSFINKLFGIIITHITLKLVALGGPVTSDTVKINNTFG